MTLGNSNLVSINASTQSATSSVVVSLRSSAQITSSTANSSSTIGIVSIGKVGVNCATSDSVSDIDSDIRSSVQIISSTQSAVSDFNVVIADPPSVTIDASCEDSVTSVSIENINLSGITSTTDNSAGDFEFDIFEPYIPVKVVNVDSIRTVVVSTTGPVIRFDDVDLERTAVSQETIRKVIIDEKSKRASL